MSHVPGCPMFPRCPTMSYDAPQSHGVPRSPNTTLDIPRHPMASWDVVGCRSASHNIPRHPTQSLDVRRRPTPAHDVPTFHNVPRIPTTSRAPSHARPPTTSHPPRRRAAIMLSLAAIWRLCHTRAIWFTRIEADGFADAVAVLLKCWASLAEEAPLTPTHCLRPPLSSRI